MKQIISWLVMLVGTVAIFIYLLGNLSDSRANEIRAQAFLVAAKSDAQKDYLAFALPYVLLGLGFLGAVIVIILTIIFVVMGIVGAIGVAEYGRIQRAEQRALSQAQTQPIVVNLHISGGSRRQQYKALSEGLVIDQNEFNIEGAICEN